MKISIRTLVGYKVNTGRYPVPANVPKVQEQRLYLLQCQNNLIFFSYNYLFPGLTAFSITAEYLGIKIFNLPPITGYVFGLILYPPSYEKIS